MSGHDHEGFGKAACDHANNPRNRGRLDIFNGHSRITGPCGDVMEFWIYVDNGIIKKVSFETSGCGSSLACGSIASILAEGRQLEKAAAMDKREILDALGGLPPEMRHCAMLAAVTLKIACLDYSDSKKEDVSIQQQVDKELHESEEWRQAERKYRFIKLGQLKSKKL